MTRAIVTLSLVLIAGAAASVGIAEPYYATGFEDACDLRFWVAGGDIGTPTVELTDQDPAAGARCAVVDFAANAHVHYAYFKVPLGLRWTPEMSLVIDGMVKVQAPEHVSVSLGLNRRLIFQGEDVQGNRGYTPVVEERERWVRLLSEDVNVAIEDDLRGRGVSPLVEVQIDSVYLNIVGVREGDHVTVWLDDLAVRPAAEADEAAWAAQRAAEQVDLPVPDYPWLDDYFAFGLTGSLEGQNRILELPDEVVAALVARDLKENFADTCARFGGIVMARWGEEGVAALGRLLDLTAEHGFRVEVSTYLTGYYEPEASRADLEALIERVVPMYRDHPGLLSWYIWDEPRPELPLLRDHWLWGRERFEALDPDTPVMTSFNNPASVRYYAPHAAVTQIDWYPISRAQFPGSYPAIANAPLCEAAWESGARRIWFIPQAFADERKRLLPTAAEIRLMTYQPLACGATGILFYSHQTRPAWHPWGGADAVCDLLFVRRSEMAHEALRLSQIVPVIGPVLLGTRWVRDSGIEVACEEIPVFAIPAVRADLNRGADYDVIVVTNQDVTAPQAATITFPAEFARGRMLMDLHELKPLELAGGRTYEITLEPGDGRFLALVDSGDVFDRLNNEISRRRYAKLLRIFEVELAEARACGIDVAAVEAHAATAAEVVGRDEDLAGPIAASMLEDAREDLQAAFAGDARCGGCAARLEALRTLVSDASARFEAYALTVPVAGRREFMAEEMGAHVEAMLEAIRDWYRLRYALMTGDVEGCRAALPAAEQRAQATVAAMDAATAAQ